MTHQHNNRGGARHLVGAFTYDDEGRLPLNTLDFKTEKAALCPAEAAEWEAIIKGVGRFADIPVVASRALLMHIASEVRLAFPVHVGVPRAMVELLEKADKAHALYQQSLRDIAEMVLASTVIDEGADGGDDHDEVGDGAGDLVTAVLDLDSMPSQEVIEQLTKTGGLVMRTLVEEGASAEVAGAVTTEALKGIKGDKVPTVPKLLERARQIWHAQQSAHRPV